MVHGLEDIKKNNEDHATYIWSRMTDAERKAHPSLNPETPSTAKGEQTGKR